MPDKTIQDLHGGMAWVQPCTTRDIQYSISTGHYNIQDSPYDPVRLLALKCTYARVLQINVSIIQWNLYQQSPELRDRLA